MADQSTSQPRKKLYIETVGCQMNVLDSELVVARLREQGYELTTEIDQADTILYNTCSVRQHAEDKIYSALGRIKHIKRRRPEVSIGVLGCMAQKDQEQILKLRSACGRGRRAGSACTSAPASCSCQGSRVAAARRQSRPRRRIASSDHGQLRGL